MDFVRRLDFARGQADVKFEVLSAMRCQKHNKEVGGVADSAHLKGFATDLLVISSHMRYRIIEGARRAGIKRIGLYTHLPNLIHVDTDPSKVREVVWFNGRRRTHP